MFTIFTNLSNLLDDLSLFIIHSLKFCFHLGKSILQVLCICTWTTWCSIKWNTCLVANSLVLGLETLKSALEWVHAYSSLVVQTLIEVVGVLVKLSLRNIGWLLNLWRLLIWKLWWLLHSSWRNLSTLESIWSSKFALESIWATIKLILLHHTWLNGLSKVSISLHGLSTSLVSYFLVESISASVVNCSPLFRESVIHCWEWAIEVALSGWSTLNRTSHTLTSHILLLSLFE